MGPLIILLVCLLGFAVRWFFLRAPRPEIPPLSMDENDPLMSEAMQKGRWSTEEFLRLFSARPQGANVKVRFKSSSGTVEYIWAEVLKQGRDQLQVAEHTAGHAYRKTRTPANISAQ